ncbi:hypothetical protein [Rhizobium binxianense]
MADARTTFHDVLSEIAVFGHAGDVEQTFRWTVEYLTRRDVFYQFGGRCHSHLVSASGQRFDGGMGTLTVLPGNLAVSAMTDFAQNAVVAFYTGMNNSVSAIAREALDCSVQAPEVLLVEIVSEDMDELARMRSTTRLAFVGLEPASHCLFPHMPCADIMTTEEFLHPFWCRDRRQFAEEPPQVRIG